MVKKAKKENKAGDGTEKEIQSREKRYRIKKQRLLSDEILIPIALLKEQKGVRRPPIELDDR